MPRPSFEAARLPLAVGLLAVLWLSAGCQTPIAPEPPSPALRLEAGRPDDVAALAEEVAGLLPSDESGAAIAVVRGGRVALAFAGRVDLSPDTLFELGSITKVATANLVVQRVLDDALDLDTGLDRLPGGDETGPQWSGVTLRHLLTHSSGLSGWPPNWGPIRIVFSGSLSDPFAPYDAEDLLEGMRRNRQPRTGERWTYSNYGFAILGRILEREAGSDFATLMQDRFLEPLSMRTATVHGWSSEAIASPRTRRGGEATSWNFSAFAPAGALRGSLRDALAFLQHAMTACDGDDLPSRATCLAQQPAGFQMNEESEMGLGWVRTTRGNATVIWHNGGTGGYSTFLGFSPERRTGVVILTNVGFLREIDGLAIEAIAAPGEPRDER